MTSVGWVRWVARGVVSGEGGSMGRRARPTPGQLPEGPGPAAIAREVRGEAAWC